MVERSGDTVHENTVHETERSLHRFNALGGPNEIHLRGASEAKLNEIALRMEGEARRIEAHLSRYRAESIVSQINAQAGRGTPVAVDAETAGLINFAQTLYKESEGLFDITSGVLRRAWSFRQPWRVPAPSEIEALLPLVGWEKVIWDGTRLELPVTGMEIDLGGVGKEYAVDRLATIAAEYGVSAMVNCGGDCRVMGSGPGARPWRIGITHPRMVERVLATFELEAGSVATSGDYQRCIVAEGKRYSHILNPHTGFPVESFQSVSVLAESCLVAGGAATCAMLLGEQRGLRYLDDLGLPMLAVASDGAVIRRK